MLFCKNLELLKLDDYIADIFIRNVGFLKYIHPNLITISGIIMNIYIYYLLNNNSDKYILGICLFYRWLVDILDGAVARKYNKTSKLGNILDTFSDFMIGFILYNYIQKYIFNFSLEVFTFIYIVIISLMIHKYNLLDNHYVIKNKKKNIIDYFNGFMVDNSILHYLIFYIIYFNH